MTSSTIQPNDTIQIRSWRTPLTVVPDRTIGTARLRHARKYRGVYHFEGTKGFEYYQVRKPFVCTYLQRRNSSQGKGWRTWMTDDPLHWIAMRSLCLRLPAGKILCAGLGLGLMAHHLCKRADISRLRIVELSSDVIELISPTLPQDPRIEIINDDFYSYIRRPEACDNDAVLWDLAVGNAKETIDHFKFAFAQVLAETGLPLYQFGLRKWDHIFGTNERQEAA
jgi:hypothetical protein